MSAVADRDRSAIRASPLQFAAVIDPVVNARCIALAASLETLALRGVRDVVPTYNAVTVHFDPLATDREASRAELEPARRRRRLRQPDTRRRERSKFP